MILSEKFLIVNIAKLLLNFQATCFTRRIAGGYGSANSLGPPGFMSSDYSGDFPCALYNCTGCNHSLVCGQDVIGFPFKLEEKIGKGGFASVYRGRFHQGQAAFKFVKIKDEQTYTYDLNAVGFYEYHQHEMVENDSRKIFANRITRKIIFWLF